MEDRKNNFLVIFVVLLLVIVGILLYFVLKPKEKLMISFNTNTEQRLDAMEIKKGDSINLPSLERENYQFLGWYIGDVKIDNNYKFDKSATLNAKWEESHKKYTITFDSDGGSKIESLTLDCGKIMLPKTPTKSGYTFVEWQDTNGNKVDNNSTLSCQDQVVKAIWKKNEANNEKTKYTVTFNSNGGSSVSSQTVESGKKASKPANPTRSGYTFKEWQLDGKAYNFDNAVTKNITLTAKWDVINNSTAKKHKVTFQSTICSYYKCDNAKCASSCSVKKDIVEVNDGEKVTKPKDPVSAGHEFIEWQLNGKKFDFNNTPIKSDITLVASFKDTNTVTTTHTVKFVINECNCNSSSSVSATLCEKLCKEEIKEIKVKDGGVVAEPVAPTKSGYKFAGWFLDGKKYDFKTPITKDITLVAKWETNSSTTVTHTVTFITDNCDCSSSSDSDAKICELLCKLKTNAQEIKVKDGGVVAEPVAPTKSGYKFAGWYLDGKKYDFKTPVTKDITLIAKWDSITK